MLTDEEKEGIFWESVAATGLFLEVCEWDSHKIDFAIHIMLFWGDGIHQHMRFPVEKSLRLRDEVNKRKSELIVLKREPCLEHRPKLKEREAPTTPEWVPFVNELRKRNWKHA